MEESLKTRWEKFLEAYGNAYEDMREAINNFANIEASSYEEYNQIWNILADYYLKGDDI
jgi:hypothetical protein